MTASSIAIWNRKKAIVWISLSLWLNNTAFLLLCKSLSLRLSGIQNLMSS